MEQIVVLEILITLISYKMQIIVETESTAA
jgi:hypothetical protein